MKIVTSGSIFYDYGNLITMLLIVMQYIDEFQANVAILFSQF